MKPRFENIRDTFALLTLLCVLQVCCGFASQVAAQSPGRASNDFTLTNNNGYDIGATLAGLNTTGQVQFKVKMRTALPFCAPHFDGTFIEIRLRIKKGAHVFEERSFNVNNQEKEFSISHNVAATDFNQSGNWNVEIKIVDVNKRDVCGNYIATFPTTTDVVTVNPSGPISIGPGDFRDFTFNMPNVRGQVKVIVTWSVLGIPAPLSVKLLKPSGSVAAQATQSDGNLSFNYAMTASDPVAQAWKVQVKNTSLLPINDIRVKIQHTPN